MENKPKLCPRCIVTLRNGEQCSRRTCMTFPCCWQHLEINKGLRVKSSKLLKEKNLSGKGLFATRPFEKWQTIGIYSGPIIETSLCDGTPSKKDKDRIAQTIFKMKDGEGLEFQKLPNGACHVAVLDSVCDDTYELLTDYIMNIEKKWCHDARFYNSYVAKYVNDCRPVDQRARLCKLNAQFFLDKEWHVISIKAIKKIKAGEEIFAAYGKDYWKSIATRPPPPPSRSRSRSRSSSKSQPSKEKQETLGKLTGLYLEKQKGAYCGLHAINNIAAVWPPQWTTKQLKKIADDLIDVHIKGERGTAYNASGDYDIFVLVSALKQHYGNDHVGQLTTVPSSMKNFDALLVNTSRHGGHWLAYRKHKNRWYLRDSFTGEEKVTVLNLRKEIRKACKNAKFKYFCSAFWVDFSEVGKHHKEIAFGK